MTWRMIAGHWVWTEMDDMTSRNADIESAFMEELGKHGHAYLQGLQQRIWQITEDAGFHAPSDHDGVMRESSLFERIALVGTEVSEALEETRIKREDRWKYYGEGGKPEGIGPELADIVIRVLGLCQIYGLDLYPEIEEKVAFNATRPYKHGKAF